MNEPKTTATAEFQQKKSANQLLLSRPEILRDYGLVVQSRAASVVGRREVLGGKAKFGIFGDGKELAQVAMAKSFQKGDFRAGYYRDQTLMFALGISNLKQFFAQLYAHTDLAADPHSGGRQMNAHYATRSLNEDGSWRDLTQMYNSSADMSPTAAQMPRLVGLGYASRLYRELDTLSHLTQFSHHGDEVAFGTIGNASCAEGHFWEAINAIGVLRAPVVLSIWDDGYGISVTNEYQLAKVNVSELLQGFQRERGSREGLDLYTVNGWDYPRLVEIYAHATAIARRDHVPAIIHVDQMTQPQGHSTSGSHERYKPAERLAWEEEFDGILKFREWIIEQRIAEKGELDQIDRNARKIVENARIKAWKAFSLPIFRERQQVADLIQAMVEEADDNEQLGQIRERLLRKSAPFRRDIMAATQEALIATRHNEGEPRRLLAEWKLAQAPANRQRYSTHLYGESTGSALRVEEIRPQYLPGAKLVNGYQILNAAFDDMLRRDPRVFAFGEDVGKLGGVNQTYSGLQAKYGELRVSDTGIRETTILGQAIGMALRGLRPIAEIQYLDYVLYALQTLSDDLSTLHWRTRGGQRAPVIISTRGHRLEGIWHSGSPMAGIINLVRGIHVVVPRDMTRAAAFYNTLLLGDEPGLVIEVLNAYRLKEKMPANIGQITIPLGMPEILRRGRDVTVVTYGACCQIAHSAAKRLAEVDIELEIVDVQTLLPFDRDSRIVKSLKETNRILFFDEDVPGGASAYMMQKVIEEQGGYYWLDSEPRTLSAKDHRAAYGTDGGYFSKPNVEDLVEVVYDMMNESDPQRYPRLHD